MLGLGDVTRLNEAADLQRRPSLKTSSQPLHSIAGAPTARSFIPYSASALRWQIATRRSAIHVQRRGDTCCGN
ncbi:MAG: hypothetical protein HY260_13590 [Chloroflexi bacterium]|nr:hypothetical protein [Chloroflexota bacterium]